MTGPPPASPDPGNRPSGSGGHARPSVPDLDGVPHSEVFPGVTGPASAPDGPGFGLIPVRRTVPSRISKTASADGAMASMTGATMRAVAPLATRSVTRSIMSPDPFPVNAAERLVEEDDRRIGEQGPRHHRALGAARGQHGHPEVDDRYEPEPFHELGGTHCAIDRLRQSGDLPEQFEVLDGVDTPVEAAIVGEAHPDGPPDVELCFATSKPSTNAVPRVRRDDRGQRANQSRLSRAVRPSSTANVPTGDHRDRPGPGSVAL